MHFRVPFEKYFGRTGTFFATLIRILLNVLLIIIIGALAVGVYKAGYDLVTSINKPLESLLQQVLLDVVFIVALVEIAITLIGYLKDGFVHVRYIIDTILIIMLNEVVTLWFKGASLEEAIGISVVLAILAGVRVTAVRFGPKEDHQTNETKPKLAK